MFHINGITQYVALDLKGSVCGYKGPMKDLAVIRMHCVLTVSVSRLVVTMCDSFAKCYLQR